MTVQWPEDERAQLAAMLDDEWLAPSLGKNPSLTPRNVARPLGLIRHSCLGDWLLLVDSASTLAERRHTRTSPSGQGHQALVAHVYGLNSSGPTFEAGVALKGCIGYVAWKRLQNKGSKGALAPRGRLMGRFDGGSRVTQFFAAQNVPKERCKMWRSFRAATIRLVLLFYVKIKLFYVKIKLSQCHCCCLKGVICFRVIVPMQRRAR